MLHIITSHMYRVYNIHVVQIYPVNLKIPVGFFSAHSLIGNPVKYVRLGSTGLVLLVFLS